MRYYMLNKPYGSVSARSDSNHPTVMDCFPTEDRNVLFPIGRLDGETTGLMIITDDGSLCQRLANPESGVEKEYYFAAFGRISPEGLAQLTAGLELPGSGFRTAPAQVHIEEETTVLSAAHMLPRSISDSALKNPTGPVTIGRICITQGHRHQVRLMLKAAGCHVFVLQRRRIGGLFLDPTLEPGQYRPLTPEEVRFLQAESARK